MVCEDMWLPGAGEALAEAGADFFIVPHGSPFRVTSLDERTAAARERVNATGKPLMFVNQLAGQDEVVFEGAAFIMDRAGEIVHRAPQFEPGVFLSDWEDRGNGWECVAGPNEIWVSGDEMIYRAVVLGVRDYIEKNRFPGVVIGLSGGVDSALTAAIAVDALGADRVRAVMMPSPYTAQISLDDAREMARTLGVRYDEFPIEPAMKTFAAMLEREFAASGEKSAADTTEENLQARIRGMILMALSNKYGSIVLTTGNKSEMAVGYATLYGDMAGGFAVIKDIYKTMVWRLSRYRNTQSPAIPERIITRPPSAELKPDQTDQDTLPPYEVLDAIIEAYMERDLSPREIVALGYAEADVRRTVGMLKRSEYKRRQAPIGIRVTRRGFGKDWRYPITSRYADEW